jgi:elongation factor G
MAKFGTEHLRNIVLLSHGGAGKTSLSEAMLFRAGVISRMGRTDDGTTTSDYEAEEHKRTASTQTSILPCPWKNHKINVIDTPGYADFRGEVVSGISVAEGAVIVVAAPAGVEVGTRQLWQMAGDRNLPRVLFVNKMDRENVDFQTVLASVVEAFGRGCVATQVPIGAEAEFSGFVDLLDSDVEVAADLQDTVEAARETLVEAIAETDDDLTMKYLEGEALTAEEMTAGLKQGVASGAIIPVMFGAATENLGAKELLDTIVDLMPSPAERKPVIATVAESDEQVPLSGKSDDTLVSQVFKTAADPFVGKLSYIRVFSGTFESDSQVWNASKKEAERVGQVYIVTGKDQESVSELAAGDIGAVSKLSSVVTGDALGERSKPVTLPGFEFPAPVYQMAASPKSKADLDKITSALARISEEDPSLRVTREPDTLEMLLGGLGDVHVEVAVEKMKRKFGVEIELNIPTVPYKETITTSASAEYRHKKQSGGHGQFGHVLLNIEPLSRGV